MTPQPEDVIELSIREEDLFVCYDTGREMSSERFEIEYDQRN